MSKRPNLAAALHDAGARPALGQSTPPATIAEVTTLPAHQQEPPAPAERRVTVRPPSREGLRAVTVYVKPEVHKQLRMLGIDTGDSVQELMIQALNDLFHKHGRSRIA